jgi:hypothetical protein
MRRQVNELSKAPSLVVAPGTFLIRPAQVAECANSDTIKDELAAPPPRL